MIKLIAFDLDGTLTQHRTPIEENNRRFLTALAARYRTVMLSAGEVDRIFSQIGRAPMDILGNYGMQYARYTEGSLQTVYEQKIPIDRPAFAARIEAVRRRFGLTDYRGDGVFFYETGMATFPLLGTGAHLAEKLAFDPDRTKRRALYPALIEAFPDYSVVLAGSSSFDLLPHGFDKARALASYVAEWGFKQEETLFVGDDFGMGGGDASVRDAGFLCEEIADYRRLPEQLAYLLEDV